MLYVTTISHKMIVPIRLQYLQNERAQNTWFSLLIYAIATQLRLVGVIKGRNIELTVFQPQQYSKTARYLVFH